MPTFFVIEELSGEYNWKDFEVCDLAYDYAADIYNIPEECIEEIEISIDSKKVEITLFEDEAIVSEDWYHCLLIYAA